MRFWNIVVGIAIGVAIAVAGAWVQTHIVQKSPNPKIPVQPVPLPN